MTTVGDLYRWDQNFYTAKVGGSEFVELMQTRGRYNDGRDLSYATGLFVREYKGLPIVHHGGAMLGFRTFLGRFPEQGLSVILLGNMSSYDGWAKAVRSSTCIWPIGIAWASLRENTIARNCSRPATLLHARGICSCAVAGSGGGSLRWAPTSSRPRGRPFSSSAVRRGQVAGCVVSTERARKVCFEKQPTRVRVRRPHRIATVSGGRRRR